MNVDVVNGKNEKVGTIELPKGVFDVAWKPELVHQALVAQRANRRKPIAHAKDRGEVAGTGKKPWRQKHTGRARVGSAQSPLWRGGGITFGPSNERVFKKNITKNMRRIALLSLLSRKAKDGEVVVIDAFSLPEAKTKHMAGILSAVAGKKKTALLVPVEGKSIAVRSGRNIAGTLVLYPSLLNVYDCMTHETLVVERDAVVQIGRGKK